MAVVEARRRRDPGPKQLAVVARERVRVAPRGGAEIAPPRIVPVPAEPQPLAVVVTRPAPARTRRQPWSDERKRRFQRRFLPTATALGARADPDRPRAARRRRRPRRSRCRPWRSVPTPLPHARAAGAATRPSRGGSSSVMPEVVWRDSISLGLPYHGRLIDGVQLPAQSPLWTTWDPALDRVPDRGYRRYGSAKLIHLLLSVAQAYHAEQPDAPRLVIGDISRYGGGPLDEHVSHQNGLDVDVYYPRTDGARWRPRRSTRSTSRARADLLEPLPGGQPEFVFVGPHLPLHGPAGVVEPLTGHDNHMHVRIFP